MASRLCLTLVLTHCPELNTKSSEILVPDVPIESTVYTRDGVSVVGGLGEAFEVTFHTVLGMKAVSPHGEDLSHIAESADSPFLPETCYAVEEPASRFKKFSFISAWCEEPLLTVMAIDVHVSPLRVH
jgi:hypothetical protein